MPTPDPPLLKGEVEEISFDFGNTEPPPDSPIKLMTDGPVSGIDQSDQAPANTSEPKTPPGDSSPEPIKEPVPNPEPVDIVKITPARCPWYQSYHDPSNIIES